MTFPHPVTVLIGLGANLPGRQESRLANLLAALAAMEGKGLHILARSPWYESEPVPVSQQPWFINAAIAATTLETANNCLQILHKIEESAGRSRSAPNAPRPLDLDLLAYGDAVVEPARACHGTAVLPHPRLHERAFVLRPLGDIAPNWRHPVLRQRPAELLARLGPVAGIRLLAHSAAAQ